MTIPVLIIGAGPSGHTAAIYAARASLSPVVLAGPEPGGQLMWTTDVENFPGFAKPIQGPALMEEMMAQAQNCGATYLYETVTHVDFSSRPFKVTTDVTTHHAKTVILATGASAKWLGLDSEKTFQGHGVSSCAVCDGFFFRGKDVAVVGGGNTAVEDALYLARHASSVTLIHRGQALRAEKILQQRLFESPSIKVLYNHVVTLIQGDTTPQKKVTSVVLENTLTHATSVLPLSGLFVAIGHTPNTGIVKDWLPLTPSGYVDTPTPVTPIKGVFAAGDVRDAEYRQAVTAAAEGCQAALLAERFLTREG